VKHRLTIVINSDREDIERVVLDMLDDARLDRDEEGTRHSTRVTVNNWGDQTYSRNTDVETHYDNVTY
jgi:hypothetical protein